MAGVTVSGVLWKPYSKIMLGKLGTIRNLLKAGVEINGEMTYKGSGSTKLL